MPCCIICNEENAKFCDDCHSATYCSEKCQLGDSPTHIFLCRSFKRYEVRPSQQMKRGILFPEDRTTPAWVWMDTGIKHGYESLILEGHQMISSVDPMTPSVDPEEVLHMSIKHNHTRKRELENTLAILYLDTKVRDDSRLNKSILVVAGGVTASPWYGSVIVMKKLGLGTKHTTYGDMDLRAYCDVIDTLKYDYLPDKSEVSTGESSMHSHYSTETSQGVMISCRGDIMILGGDKYLPVNVSILDPVFDPVSVADKATSSEMVGVPVRARKLPPYLDWTDSGQVNMFENQGVTRLFRNMDPDADSFGLAPMSWDLRVGSVLVARANYKDITPHQVEALCYYMSEHTQETIEKALEARDLHNSNKEIDRLMALFTPDAFREFFTMFRLEKAVRDATWETAESPV